MQAHLQRVTCYPPGAFAKGCSYSFFGQNSCNNARKKISATEDSFQALISEGLATAASTAPQTLLRLHGVQIMFTGMSFPGFVA